ncbi:ABC transporter permease [Flavobacteriaceae bacterium MHTCC 0001]
MLIAIWIKYEMDFDQFHENNHRIYEVNNQTPVDGEIWTWNSTPKIMAPVIKKDYPEVEYASRYYYDSPFMLSAGDKRLKTLGTTVDPDFLKIFSFPLLEGDVETVLSGVNSVVITQNLAKKLFEDKDPIGKIIKIDNTDSFTVTGVLKNLPQNTDFKFELLIPWAYLGQKGRDDTYWANNSVATYVMLREGTNYANFSKKIKNLREKYDKNSPNMVTYLYPFSRTHLYSEFENGVESGGKMDMIRMIGTIAFIILIIACINFMNLSTAQGEKRAKEVGVRKVVGAKKQMLIFQFLSESLLITFIAALFAFIIVLLVLPAFSLFTETELSLNITNKWFWLSAGMMILFTGLVAGSYPALYLSAFKPSLVLKGAFNKINALITPRKILVVVQFSMAVALISATIVIKQQLSKVQNRQTGYSKDNLVYTSIEGDVGKNYALIKDELLSSGIATSITKTSSPITESWSNWWGFEWQGKDINSKTLINRFTADDAFVRTIGLELIEGRDFDLKKFPSDSTAAIINETAVNLMGFKNPIGQIIKDNGIDWRVIGVVKDFVLESPFHDVAPMIIEGAKGYLETIHIKYNPAYKLSESLTKTETIFKKFNPEYPFNYEFVDKVYAQKFEDIKKVERLASILTLLTIIISCLGLFGLATYMAQNRTKEIGVRKILGASIAHISYLLTKEFLKPILFAFIIGFPLAWYFMNKWLDTFTYRVSISWWIFAISGVLILFIAIITVSYQSMKASISNPIKSLRTE